MLPRNRRRSPLTLNYGKPSRSDAFMAANSISKADNETQALFAGLFMGKESLIDKGISSKVAKSQFLKLIKRIILSYGIF